MKPVVAVEALTAKQRPAASIDLDAEADRDRCGALNRYWYVACLADELGRDRPLARRPGSLAQAVVGSVN